MNGHLVTVKIGVKGSTYQRVKLNSFAFVNEAIPPLVNGLPTPVLRISNDNSEMMTLTNLGSSSSLPLLHPRRVVDVPEQAGAVSSSLGRSEASRLKRKTKKGLARQV